MDGKDPISTPDKMSELMGGSSTDEAAIGKLLAEFGRRHAADIVSGNTTAAKEEFEQIQKLFPSTNTQ